MRDNRKLTVQEGDNLSSLASSLGVSLEDLVKTNDIQNPEMIYPGQELLVPGFPQAPASYEVQAGDYLGKIAQQRGTSVEDILKMNPSVTSPDKIYPGQVLKLNSGASSTYTVQQGDYLGKIANRHGVSVSDLQKSNNIKDPDKISVGQKLTIPGISKSKRPTSIDRSSFDFTKAPVEEIEEYNKQATNKDKIFSYEKATNKGGTFLVEDKKKHTVTVYKNGKPVRTFNTVSGKTKGSDAMTVTKTDGRGKIISGAGNMSTPAGFFQIKGKGWFKGAPSIQRGLPDTTKEHIFNMIPSSVHKRGVFEKNKCNRTNGCTGLTPTSLKELSKLIDVGDNWYILPEEEGNEFELTGYGLAFKSKDVNQLPSFYPTNKSRDIKDIEIGEGIPEEARENVRSVTRYLKDSKETIRKKHGLTSDQYDKLLPLAIGIMGRESGYGKPGLRGTLGLLKDELAAGLGYDNISAGPFQIRQYSLSEKERNKIGIDNVETLQNDPHKGAEAAMVILNNIYKYQVPKYREKYPELSDEQIALAFYANPAGFTKEDGEMRIPYANAVMKNSENITVKYGLGGDVLSGAASGAAAGAAIFPPWGAVAGGVLGAVSSYVGGKKKQEQEALQEEYEQQAKDVQTAFAQYDNTNNMRYQQMFPYGGELPYGPPNAELEGGESFETPMGGNFEVEGPSHAGGGVPMALDPGTRIYSDRLKVPGTKETFSNANKKLASKIEKYKDKIDNPRSTATARRTAERMVANLEKEQDSLFQTQEEYKQQMGMGQPPMNQQGLPMAVDGLKVKGNYTFNNPGYGLSRYDYMGAGLSPNVPMYSGFGMSPSQSSGTTGINLGQQPSLYQQAGGRDFAGEFASQFDPKADQGQFGGYGLSDFQKNTLDPTYGVADEAPTTTPPSKNKVDWGNVGMSALALAPTLVNLGRGLFESPEQVDPQDYMNTAGMAEAARLRSRRHNVAPELAASERAYATGRADVKSAARTRGELLGNYGALASMKAQRDAQIRANASNIENQYMSEAAQMAAQTGAQASATRLQAEDMYDRNAAAARQMTNEGLTGISQYAQLQQQMANQKAADELRADSLRYFAPNSSKYLTHMKKLYEHLGLDMPEEIED